MILTAMPSNCQHCGRPISGIPTTIYSRPYHYECTRSPYAQLAKPQPTSHDVADAELIKAAEKYAEVYDGDDREMIKTDVINAFYQGWKLYTKPQPTSQDVLDAERYRWLRELISKPKNGSIFNNANAYQAELWHRVYGRYGSNVMLFPINEELDNFIDAAMKESK